jgi:hypothetical protein
MAAGLAWLGGLFGGFLLGVGCLSEASVGRPSCEFAGGGPESVFFWAAPTLAAALIIASSYWARGRRLLLICIAVLLIEAATYTILGIIVSQTFSS